MKLFLTEEQIHILLSLAEENARDFALFHVALSTGLRVSDLGRIEINDVVDLDGAIVESLRLRMKKTKSYIERSLRPDCRIAVKRYLSGRSDRNPYLFRSQSRNSALSTGPMNRSSIHRIYKKYLGQMFTNGKLRGNACHVTRRSVAKLIVKKTSRIEPATSFLGHKSVTSTMAYIDMDSWGQKADETVEELIW